MVPKPSSTPGFGAQTAHGSTPFSTIFPTPRRPTPGWSSPARRPRFTVDTGVPLLGVCYGHQLLGEAIGGRGTVRKAQGPEVGYLDIEMKRGDPLFDCFPEVFTSFLTHGDEVVPADGFEVWGRSEACPVQAIRVPDAQAWGVQFHNEYPEPEQMRLLRMRQGKHPELGYDAEAMFAERTDTAVHARAMFDRFLEICGWP